MTLIDLRNVSLKARGFGPVNLSFEVGEIVLLCGPSGSGKSTLCELLSGIQEPSSGGICIQDVEVGYVAHDFENQLLGSTVREELELGLSGATSTAARDKGLGDALEALLSPLNNYLSCDPQNLPSSAQQHLLLASLARCGARFLILDESLSHLDPPSRVRFLAILTSLARSGFTILIVSHQTELLAVADRVVMMERGTVSYDGDRRNFETSFFEKAGFRSEHVGETLLCKDTQVNETGSTLSVCSLEYQMALDPGRSLVIGGLSGAGSSRTLNTLFGLDDLEVWSLLGSSKPNCLLRQHLVPSFWRSTCAQELNVSRGAYANLPKALETAVLDSIPAGWLAKPPWHLSHGQLRFFGASCLILQMPQVLFLDRPFQGLDGALREKLRYSLSEFLKYGGRIVLTTHDSREVRRFGDQVIWLKEGEVQYQGRTESEEWRIFASLLSST